MKKRILCTALTVLALGTPLTTAAALPVPPMPATASTLPVEPVAHRHGLHRVRGVYYYNGHRGYVVARPGYHYHRGYWFPAAAFAAGAAVTAPPPAPYRRPAAAHVAWCYETYRSYQAWDNTYQPYHGPRRQCWSPYS